MSHTVTFGHWQMKFELDGYRPLPISYWHHGFQMPDEPIREIADELFTRACNYCIEQFAEKTT